MSTVVPISGDRLADEGYVEFRRAGAVAKGMFCCVECGHTAASFHQLPLCPDCFGQLWERRSTRVPPARR